MALSETVDFYSTFQEGRLGRYSDFFIMITEIILTIGFLRMFNLELVKDKKHQLKLEIDLTKSRELLSAAMQMTASLDLEETLQILLQRTIALTDADLAALFLNHQSGNLTGHYFALRRDASRVDIRGQDWEALTQQIISGGRFVIIENFPEEPEQLSAKLPGKLIAFGGFPLRESEKILGVLFVGFEQAHQFGEEQQLLLMSFADQGSLALRNAVLYEKVKELSNTDPLTGLANRRKFDQALVTELARARRYDNSLSLVLFDVDNFKQVNDTLGHSAGDAVLDQLAGLLRQQLRLADIAARFGGDEIALILPKTDLQQAELLAERLREKIRQAPFICENQTVQVTCSFGISGGKGEALSENPLDLFKQADVALYRAKNSGRDRVEVA